MTISKTLLSVGIASIAAVAVIASPAFAWHPEGVIVKKVQNVTTGSALADADSTSSAVTAKPGDILKYVITVRNDGKPDSKGYNDMAETKMTDTLPAGIELVASPEKRQITENLGLIKPGKSVTKEYTVRVTTTQEGAIKNTACFTGDSTAHDNPQKGCNPAVVTVTVPPVVPETPVTPETPADEVPVELPRTGPTETIIGSILAVGAVSYAVNHYIASKRELTRVGKAQR